MKRFSRIVALLIPLICLCYTAKYRWKGEGGDSWKTIVCNDGYGYYSYLPSIFIIHHFDYQAILEAERKANPSLSDKLSDLSLTFEGKRYDKCFAGVAVLLLPFFLLAYFFSHLLGFEVSGYSMLFQKSISLAALFYLLIGLLFIRRLLKMYAIHEAIIALVLILVSFGTNLFYYVTIEPSMAHAYSFGLAAIFLFYTKKAITAPMLKYFLLMSVALGLMVIIRPTNALCIAFIPFLAGSFPATVSFLKSFFNLKYLSLCFLTLFAIISIQLILWYLQTGHFLLWSYQGESFDFSRPHFFGILFSYLCGWFIYTPVMLLSLASLLLLFRENKYMFASFLLFFVLITYILSSWWCWWFGGYGLRAFIDFYPAFALPLALLFERLKPLWLKLAAIIIGLLFMLLNLIQSYQYTVGILPFSEMNKEKYWAVFLKTSNRYRGMLDVPLTKDLHFFDNASFTNDFEHNTLGNDNNISNKYVHSGNFSAMVSDKLQFSPTFTIACGALPQQPHLYAYINLWSFMPTFNNDARLIVDLQTADGKSYFYTPIYLNSHMDNTNTWQDIDFMLNLPAFKNTDDKLLVYVYNTKGTIYLDDFQLKFGVVKDTNMSEK